MDISTSGDTVSATLYMVYFLGYLSQRLYSRASPIESPVESPAGTGVHSDGMHIPRTIRVLHHSLIHLQSLLDIEIYSSSGVLQGVPTGSTVDTVRHLAHIHDDVYHLIRKHDCLPQVRFYRVLTTFLLSKLFCTASGLTYLGMDHTYHHGRTFADSLGLDSTLCRQAETLAHIPQMDRLERFKIQVAYSHTANVTGEKMLCADDTVGWCQRCDLACCWERMQTLANVASPESTVAPASFVDVVYRTQKQMYTSVHLDASEQYLSFIEHLGFLCGHLQSMLVHMLETTDEHRLPGCLDKYGHLRKAYKYAMRTTYAYGMLSGDPEVAAGFGLSTSVLTDLRHPEDLPADTIAGICTRLETVQNILVVHALDCAPQSIRGLVSPIVPESGCPPRSRQHRQYLGNT
jgi:hypothetical protein